MPLPVATLALPGDVEDVWRPLSTAEVPRVTNLIEKASARLRQKCPFDIDERISLFYDDSKAPTALDPAIVADVVATIVKRFLVNIEGAAASNESTGPFSKSTTWVNRYDKTGSDVRGAIEVTESDIDQLRPATPPELGGTIRLRSPHYEQRLGFTRYGPADVIVERPVNVPYSGFGTE